MNDEAKILIIDDEEIVINSCTQILKRSNYEIATARNGAEGLEILKEFQPDLTFVDLKMPGISGFEVLDQIHAYDPTIVTVVITGFATVSSAVESMKKGTYDFLPKPFTPEELRVITKRALEKRALVLETIALRNEKEMLREHFAAIVSHELKSPLGALQQNLYVLADDLSGLLTEEQAEKVERLQKRISDLVKLVNTWLRAISVDISKIKENFVPVSISTVIDKSIENVENHATRKAIVLQYSIEEPISEVLGDEVTLVEAVMNIVGNAIKYTRMGGNVSVSASQEGDQIAISVTDDGVGIASEDLPHLFKDFYIGKTTTEKERRSGVGLAITRRIVEAHDGSISVESEIGEGSTFVIHLPVYQSD